MNLRKLIVVVLFSWLASPLVARADDLPASARTLFEDESPSWQELMTSWPERAVPDEADHLLTELESERFAGSPAELTKRIVELITANPEPVRQYILLHILEQKGGRHPNAHPVLEAILTANEFVYPKSALIHAVYSTSTDAFFLSLLLREQDVAFASAAARERIMGDEDKWRDVPNLLYHCAVDNVTTDPDELEVISPSDVPALDDLERRNNCMYGLASFPTVESLDYLAAVIDQYPRLLGADATRVIKEIMYQSLKKTTADDVVRAANTILLDVLNDADYRAASQYGVLRLNAAIGLAVPRNRAIDRDVVALLQVERDQTVATFLRQARQVIQLDDYE